jgi:hypothetical protein
LVLVCDASFLPSSALAAAIDMIATANPTIKSDEALMAVSADIPRTAKCHRGADDCADQIEKELKVEIGR